MYVTFWLDRDRDIAVVAALEALHIGIACQLQMMEDWEPLYAIQSDIPGMYVTVPREYVIKDLPHCFTLHPLAVQALDQMYTEDKD